MDEKMILLSEKELDIIVPENIVFTDNGAYDLEKAGISGYYTWIGYEHTSNGSSNMKSSKQLEKYVYNEVVPIFEDIFNSKVVVDDKRDTTDMFRIWASTVKKKYN